MCKCTYVHCTTVEFGIGAAHVSILSQTMESYISAAQAIYMYMHQHVYTPLASDIEVHICVDACVFV